MRSSIAVALTVMGCVMTLPAAAQDATSLNGTWKGPRDRIHSTQGNRSDTITYVISEQNGMTFRAKAIYQTVEGEKSETFVGAFPRSGSFGVGAGKNGTHLFEIVDAQTINFCYTEVGEQHLTSCGTLTKQP
ncbi:hypothetical protein [Ancylobacter sp.]|uniref:hypothetical protein n=1 Tax=Ancylobacter sp. TaxID=1872567 RepID=UPI003D0A8E4E